MIQELTISLSKTLSCAGNLLFNHFPGNLLIQDGSEVTEKLQQSGDQF